MKMEGDGYRQNWFRVRSTSDFQYFPLVDIVQPALDQNFGSFEARTRASVKDSKERAHTQRIYSDRNG